MKKLDTNALSTVSGGCGCGCKPAPVCHPAPTPCQPAPVCQPAPCQPKNACCS